MYIILLSNILLATVNSILLHHTDLKSAAKVFRFNLINVFIWLIILLFLNINSFNFDINVFLWGVFYGTVQLLFLIFKSAAMSAGPIGITTLIGNCSLLLSTFAGAIIWNEKITAIKLLGILLLLLSVVISTDFSLKSQHKRNWLILRTDHVRKYFM